MANKRKHIEVTSGQLVRLRQEVFSNLGLSGEQRRKAAKKILALPADGSPIDLFYDGKLVGEL